MRLLTTTATVTNDLHPHILVECDSCQNLFFFTCPANSIGFCRSFEKSVESVMLLSPSLSLAQVDLIHVLLLLWTALQVFGNGLGIFKVQLLGGNSE